MKPHAVEVRMSIFFLPITHILNILLLLTTLLLIGQGQLYRSKSDLGQLQITMKEHTGIDAHMQEGI